jgi:uncharacterized damage-inducible protein DinB
MNTKLQRLYDQLEAEKQSILSSINNLSHEQLHFSPKGRWSVAQILSHIISSEQLSIKYLNKKMLGIQQLNNSGLVEEMQMIVLIVSQRLPFKFKAPKVVVDSTTHYESLESLVTAWGEVRNELRIVLERFKETELKKKIFKHPIAGMLNILQAVRFMREHLIHHTPQIKNLLKQK